MPILVPTKIFGSPLRTRVLTAVALIEETFPAELARLIQARPFPVQRVLDSLEQEGLIASRKLGVERRISLNPRYFAYKELKALLLRLGEKDLSLQQELAKRRSRPRKRGKAI